MKWSLLILIAFLVDPGKIGQVNTAKSEAKKAYQRGEYKNAVAQYKILRDSLGVQEEEVNMNLAHSYFQLNDTLNAQNSYLPLTSSLNPKFKSVANQQLGVLANRGGKFEEALNYFKNSLKTDPTNEEARYNYEMVKKKLEEKKKQEEQQQQQNKDNKKDDKKKDQKDDKENKDNKDQKDKDDKQSKEQKDKEQKDKDQKDKEQKEKEQQKKDQDKDSKEEKDKKEKENPSVSDKLKDMKMSEDKARMVLEAMKNQEVQYLQQNKRKATKPKSKNKPDW